MSQQIEEGPFFYIHETDKALCIAKDDDEGSEAIWLPFFWKGEEVTYRRKGTKVWVYAPEDLLLEKGLI
jgi:hypothetical protein